MRACQGCLVPMEVDLNVDMHVDSKCGDVTKV